MKSRVIVAAVIKKDGKILLGRKKPGVGPYPDTWHLPGGGVNLGEETLVDAVTREVKEETGLEIDQIVRIMFDDGFTHDKNKEMTHYVFLVFKIIPTGNKVVPGGDLVRLQWFEKENLKNITMTPTSTKLFKEIGLL